MGMPSIVGEFGITHDPVIGTTGEGKVWVRLRLVMKKRVRDSNGTWSDGDPSYMDCTIWQAEHLAESVSKGDSVVIIGDLEERKWKDKETGADRSAWGINVGGSGSVGVSTRWSTARTPRTIEAMGAAAGNAQAMSDPFGTSDDVPF